MRLDMVRSPDGRLVSRRRVAVVFGAGLLCLLSGVGLSYRREQAALAARQHLTELSPGAGEARIAFECPSVVTPPTRTAAGAGLADDEEVIGVEAGGRPRAYVVRVMRDLPRHIVNDLVGDRPVTITYCDMSECVRAFGGASGGAPLGIAQAGVLGSRMVVKVAGVGYLQESGAVVEHDAGVSPAPFPYGQVPAVRTTWKAWRASHPSTDVYVGDDSPPPER